MKKYLPGFVALIILMVAFVSSNAQCAMCAGQVESATSAGSSIALGVNKGVLYIFMMPYLVMGTLGYFWWRGRKNKDKDKD
jgi:hypothetical protein